MYCFTWVTGNTKGQISSFNHSLVAGEDQAGHPTQMLKLHPDWSQFGSKETSWVLCPAHSPLFFFLATPHGMRDLGSSQPGIKPLALALAIAEVLANWPPGSPSLPSCHHQWVYLAHIPTPHFILKCTQEKAQACIWLTSKKKWLRLRKTEGEQWRWVKQVGDSQDPFSQ